MANFGARLAAPLPPRRLATPHGTAQVDGRSRSMASRALAFARLVVRGALQALDDAPYDLAWPPSPRAHARWAERRAEQQASADTAARAR